FGGLLGGQYFHASAGEIIKLVGVGNVAVKGGAVKLGENEDATDSGVDAVADGDIHQAVFARQWHRGLTAISGKRGQSCTASAAQHHGNHLTPGILFHSGSVPSSISR